MSRQTKYTPDQLTPEQTQQYEVFQKTRKVRADGMMGGPFDPWILNAELFQRLYSLAGMLWNRTSLDRGLVELAISITGKVYEATWSGRRTRLGQSSTESRRT